MYSNQNEWIDPADLILDSSKKNVMFRKRNKPTPEIQAVYEQFVLTAVSLDNSRIKRMKDEVNVFGLPKMMMRKDLVSDVVCLQIVNFLHNLEKNTNAIRLANEIDALHDLSSGACRLTFVCSDGNGDEVVGDRKVMTTPVIKNPAPVKPMMQPLPNEAFKPAPKPKPATVPGFTGWTDDDDDKSIQNKLYEYAKSVGDDEVPEEIASLGSDDLPYKPKNLGPLPTPEI